MMRILDVHCPQCGAIAGERCRSALYRGHASTVFHRPRRNLARLPKLVDVLAVLSGLSAVPCFCGSRLPLVQRDREMPSCQVCNAI